MSRPAMRSYLRDNLTFFRLHLTYFVILAASGTVILRGIGGFKWIDCLYCIQSAICLCGFSSVPVESIPTGGQVVLMIWMLLGGQILTSIVPLLVKQKRYCNVVKFAVDGHVVGDKLERQFSRSEPYVKEPGKTTAKQLLRRLTSSMQDHDKWMEEMAANHEATIEGGSNLKDVVEEYKASIALTKIVVGYYILVQLVGFFIAWISIIRSPHAKRVMKRKRVNAGFFALFATISAFANCGYILANDNLMALNTSSVLLLDIVVMVLLGNTLFPPVLRGIVWLRYRFSKGSDQQVYKFLLDHPRRCYTHLFPQTTTVWLALAVAGFTGFQIIMFYVLDWDGKAMVGMNAGDKIVSGIFQASGTRTSGMNTVNIVDLTPAMLFLYVGMMYMSAYPVFLSRQHSRVQEEKHEHEKYAAVQGSERDIHDTTIATQSRRLLARDWSYLFFSIFFICISENKKLQHDPINFSVFSIIFEVISGYGNVGLTLGYSCSSRIEAGPCTDVPYSFSGKWAAVSKVFLIVVMFLGRHRGLPDNIDSAVMLPEKRFNKMLVRRSTPVYNEATPVATTSHASQST